MAAATSMTRAEMDDIDCDEEGTKHIIKTWQTHSRPRLAPTSPPLRDHCNIV